MRLLPVALLAFSLGLGAAAHAQSMLGGAQDNGAIAVPPAPPIVAAPPTPLTPTAPAAPAPPGLVPVGPPPDLDNGGTDNGAAGNGGNLDTGNGGNMDTGNAGGGTAPAQPGTGTQASPPAAQNQDQPQGQPEGQPSGQAQDQNQAPAQDVIPTPPNTWQPDKTATLGVLDKVDGGVTKLTVPVGGQAVVGDLQVSVQACVSRPADQVPDDAVFVTLQNTDNLSGPPSYRGWLVRSMPGAANAGDASETLRVIGCS